MSENFIGVNIREALKTTVRAMTTTQTVFDLSYRNGGRDNCAASGNIMPSSIDLSNHLATVDTKFSGGPPSHVMIVSKSPSGR